MSKLRFTHVETPLGLIELRATTRGLSGVYFEGHKPAPVPRILHAACRDDGHFRPVVEQLRAYLAGEIERFQLPLDPAGTPFQRQVWQRLATIPYGDTLSYGALAASLDMPAAARAVAGANARNPLSIIVPCHRVVARDGRLSGYAGGVERKQWLLDLERRARMRHAA
ncbi:methylated-DNA--[protein]-cysteine S-methyltransferase [Parapedomonas caeni]